MFPSDGLYTYEYDEKVSQQFSIHHYIYNTIEIAITYITIAHKADRSRLHYSLQLLHYVSK